MSEDRPTPDENPEWTEEDFARAKRGDDIPAHIRAAFPKRGRGRPALPPEQRKEKVNIRLSPDVLAALRAGGPGWQSRADDILRKSLRLTKR